MNPLISSPAEDAAKPPQGRQVLIAMNPHAGPRSGRPKIEHLAQLLEAEQFAVEIITDLSELSRRSAECLAAGDLRAVVAAGGDGTAAAVVNQTQVGTPIALLPLGTENLLARYVGMNSLPSTVAKVVSTGHSVEVDAGEANGRLFLLMASCGFDADVVRRLHSGRRGHIDHFTYLKPIYDSLRSYHYPAVRVYFDEELAAEMNVSLPLVARWAFVVNLPRYAGGLRISPTAVGTDGLLDVCTFRRGSLWHGLVYLAGVVLGQHPTWPDCQMGLARRIRLEADEPVPYQLDGDPGGYLPVEINVLPRRVKLLVPTEFVP